MKIDDRHRGVFSEADWTDDTDQMIVLMQCIRKPYQHVVRPLFPQPSCDFY